MQLAITKLINGSKRWKWPEFFNKSVMWFIKKRKQKGVGYECDPWWVFAHKWWPDFNDWILDFMYGNHSFEPLTELVYPKNLVIVWRYLDSLMLHLLHGVMKPTFKHTITKNCKHLSGPSAIKKIRSELEKALDESVNETYKYNYFMRIDIKSFYASIDHKILLEQLRKEYQDPMLLKYLEDIVTVGINRNGAIRLPKKGIPLRGSLSPFFGALYLKDLDEAFTKKDCFYRRYMDDVVILFKNERQFKKAKKDLFRILKKLKLKLSPHKSKMGKIEKGFHFLGIDCKNQKTRISDSKSRRFKLDLHRRTSQRALDKVKALQENAVNPAKIQRYLSRWAAWWHQVTDLGQEYIIGKWVAVAEEEQPDLGWLGYGLLGPPWPEKSSLPTN